MTDTDLSNFLTRLHQRLLDRVELEPELMLRDAFVSTVGEHLVEGGVLDDLDTCYLHLPWQKRKVEVAGYDIAGEGTILHLVAAHYGASGAAVTRDRIDQLIRGTASFADFCRTGQHTLLEKSNPSYDMVERVHAAWPQLQQIRIFVLTDGRTNLRRAKEVTIAGLSTAIHVWDAVRLQKVMGSGAEQEELLIDIAELGYSVSCLESPPQADGYRCLLAMVPGKLLAELYDEHHSRLLQRNVRAFLQARGKVNKGIAETIKNQPGRFLAYNNGVSATARSAEIESTPSGLMIRRLHELQIVNGGQTTASLHHALRRGIDLTDITVPAKITLIDNDDLDVMVPEISRYANSQNAVTAADFEGNSRFHVGLERWSRSIWTTPVEAETAPTRWYYERVRGQYDVDKGRSLTTAQRRQFEKETPTRQRFGKTDAAKYEFAYALRPDVVCQGGEKCFRTWTLEEALAEREAPDDGYFRHLVAKAIVFRQIRTLVQAEKFGGYLGQTTAYAMSMLVHTLGGLDLDLVWRQQSLPQPVAEAIPDLSRRVRHALVNPPGSANVTEWCKKPACWTEVRKVGWNAPPEVIRFSA
ncbi:AIPR family protein [Lentzea albida]|uniref:AIPR protein n=1 Tax=Lentzea albida TaxID=65499 RepID=A0A1H9BQ98_9PSEU|nr:AIPR family protein [Lentzea albida]SEP91174.1 AIPR protein [Lentzea albida]